MKAFELTLEPAEDRWTEGDSVHEWTRERLLLSGIPVIPVRGTSLRCDAVTRTGAVMDAHGRAFYGQTQTAELTRLLSLGAIGPGDVILVDDAYTPGLSGLAYALSWQPRNRWPRIYARWHAQTTDQYDFAHRLMMPWMRRWEEMLDSFVAGFFVADAGLAELMRIAGLTAPIYVTGHIFDAESVRRRVPNIKPLNERPKLIAFTSRWATEKRPKLAMRIMERSGLVAEGWRFALLTGAPELRSDDPGLVRLARDMQARGLLEIHEGLSKDEYLALLAQARLHLMTSLQDWVSYALMEASAVGTISLCPDFRSFPAALNYSRRQLYLGGNSDDAIDKMRALLADPPDERTIGHVAREQTKGLDKVADVLLGCGDQWLYRGLWHEAVSGQTEGC